MALPSSPNERLLNAKCPFCNEHHRRALRTREGFRVSPCYMWPSTSQQHTRQWSSWRSAAYHSSFATLEECVLEVDKGQGGLYQERGDEAQLKELFLAQDSDLHSVGALRVERATARRLPKTQISNKQY